MIRVEYFNKCDGEEVEIHLDDRKMKQLLTVDTPLLVDVSEGMPQSIALTSWKWAGPFGKMMHEQADLHPEWQAKPAACWGYAGAGTIDNSPAFMIHVPMHAGVLDANMARISDGLMILLRLAS